MSRSGYSDDCENLGLWRGAVARATFGARGQNFMRKLMTALDAMPEKRLIADAIQDTSGAVCALGAVDAKAPVYDAQDLARHFGIAWALAAEIVYENDEHLDYQRSIPETPEERWARMRAWVAKQITPDDEEPCLQPPSVVV